MADVDEVVAAANQLHDEKDDTALEVLIGMREIAVRANPQLKDDPFLEVKYDSDLMGPLDDLREVSRSIINRWNKELYLLVCANTGTGPDDRKALLNSLNLGETAIIAAVVAALMGLGVGGAFAAPLAPLIVRKFIMPAGDELCIFWGKAIGP